MSKVKNENFIVIQGYMINELNLKGNELLIYAIINGFSQTENQAFTGSLQYLADWTNSTKQGVIKNLKSLVEKNYIVKTEKSINGVKFCEYHVTKFNSVVNNVDQSIKQSSTEGSKQSLNNNISLNKISNNKDNKRKKENSYDLIINELVNDEDIKEAIYEFIKMRMLIKKPLTDRALKQLINKLYTLSTNKQEQLQILDNSIINNWGSIYPLKKENSHKRNEVVPKWIKNNNNIKSIDDDFEKRKKALQERLRDKYGK